MLDIDVNDLREKNNEHTEFPHVTILYGVIDSVEKREEILEFAKNMIPMRFDITGISAFTRYNR